MIPKHISEVVHGNILAADLLDSNGNLLVKKGTLLTSQLIDQIKNRGIGKVLIESTDPAAVRAFQEYKNRIATRVDLVFSRKEDNQTLMKLKAAVKAYYENNYLDI